MKGMTFAALAALSLPFVSSVARAVGEEATNDYPTVARADYVYACMQANGSTREALEKCSCSIDQIAALLSYADYEEAETVHSIELRGGTSSTIMHAHHFQEKIKSLRRAQVEAELRCF